MDLDVFGESFAFEGEKIIEQTKEVLHCSVWVTGHVECHPPLDETHLERQKLEYAPRNAYFI